MTNNDLKCSKCGNVHHPACVDECDQKRDEPGKPTCYLSSPINEFKRQYYFGWDECWRQWKSYHTHQMKKQAEEHKLRIRAALSEKNIIKAIEYEKKSFCIPLDDWDMILAKVISELAKEATI